MKKIASFFLSAILFAVIFPTFGHASLVTEHWTAYITNIYGENTENPSLTIGDEFDIAFTYDDQSEGRTVTRVSDGYTFVQPGSEDDYKDVTSFTFSSNLASAVAESTYEQTYYQTFIFTSPTSGYQQFASCESGYDLSVINDTNWNTSLRYNYKGGGEQQVSLKIVSSPVPIPSSILLFSFGLLGLSGACRKNSAKN